MIEEEKDNVWSYHILNVGTKKSKRKKRKSETGGGDLKKKKKNAFDRVNENVFPR